MKMISWNVNGLRAVHRKGFLDWLAQAQPDILGVQEIKANVEDVPRKVASVDGYHVTFASAERKGYSGVALYSRLEPKSVQIGLGDEQFDVEGRTIVAEYDDFVFITAYFPNGGAENARVPYKLDYCEHFLAYCDALRAEGQSVIFCGDLNTAHTEIDLARPKDNTTNTGFLPEERAWIDKVIEHGYLDTFRLLHPEVREQYSYWSYRQRARERNVGWRLDYFFVSDDLRDRVQAAEIHTDVVGSDHCPVLLTLT